MNFSFPDASVLLFNPLKGITMKKIIATLLAIGFVLTATSTFAADEMKKEMSKDAMKKDAPKDAMKKKAEPTK